MEREVMKKSKQNFILICIYKKIYVQTILQDKNLMYNIYEPFVKTDKIKIYQRPLCQVESSFI